MRLQNLLHAARAGESACSTEGKIRRYGESGEMDRYWSAIVGNGGIETVRLAPGSVGPLLTDHQRALTDALATGGGESSEPLRR
jgi:hypothetical protein